MRSSQEYQQQERQELQTATEIIGFMINLTEKVTTTKQLNIISISSLPTLGEISLKLHHSPLVVLAHLREVAMEGTGIPRRIQALSTRPSR